MNDNSALPSASQEIAAALTDEVLIDALDVRAEAGDNELLRQRLCGEPEDLEKARQSGWPPFRARLVEALAPLLATRTQERDALQEKVNELTRPMSDVEYHDRAPGGWMDEAKQFERELEAAERALVEARQERDEQFIRAEKNGIDWEKQVYRTQEQQARAMEAEADRDRLQGIIDAYRAGLVKELDRWRHIRHKGPEALACERDARAALEMLDRLLTISPGEGGEG